MQCLLSLVEAVGETGPRSVKGPASNTKSLLSFLHIALTTLGFFFQQKGWVVVVVEG